MAVFQDDELLEKYHAQEDERKKHRAAEPKPSRGLCFNIKPAQARPAEK